MNKLGAKIAEKRKSLGMTQIEFAEKMLVTRQTVSRWEAGTAMPDIDKIGEIADILGVSCDYLLKDETDESAAAQTRGVGKLLKSLTGKTVQLAFFDIVAHRLRNVFSVKRIDTIGKFILDAYAFISQEYPDRVDFNIIRFELNGCFFHYASASILTVDITGVLIVSTSYPASLPQL